MRPVAIGIGVKLNFKQDLGATRLKAIVSFKVEMADGVEEEPDNEGGLISEGGLKVISGGESALLVDCLEETDGDIAEVVNIIVRDEKRDIEGEYSIIFDKGVEARVVILLQPLDFELI